MNGRKGIMEEEVRARLCELIREHDLFPIEDLPDVMEQDLLEQGVMDSMTAVYLVGLISEEFGVDLDLHMVSVELNSLNTIARRVYESRH